MIFLCSFGITTPTGCCWLHSRRVVAGGESRDSTELSMEVNGSCKKINTNSSVKMITLCLKRGGGVGGEGLKHWVKVYVLIFLWETRQRCLTSTVVVGYAELHCHCGKRPPHSGHSQCQIWTRTETNEGAASRFQSGWGCHVLTLDTDQRSQCKLINLPSGTDRGCVYQINQPPHQQCALIIVQADRLTHWALFIYCIFLFSFFWLQWW